MKPDSAFAVILTAVTLILSACTNTSSTNVTPSRSTPVTLGDDDPRVIPTATRTRPIIPVRVPQATGPGIDVRPPPDTDPCVIELLVKNDVLFKKLSTEIIPERAGELRAFVEEAIALNPDRRLVSMELIGWASVEGDSVNVPLSVGRAAAARAVLEPIVRHGVHIVDRGEGETDHFDPGLDEASLAANRVVQVFLTFDCVAAPAK